MTSLTLLVARCFALAISAPVTIRHNKTVFKPKHPFCSHRISHLALVMTEAVLYASTQLKWGHMIVLTHYYYACTASVAASRCHSVPCTTSLRINYNVIPPSIFQAIWRSATPPADREATNLLARIPLVGMHNPFREAFVDYVRQELSIFWSARVTFYPRECVNPNMWPPSGAINRAQLSGFWSAHGFLTAVAITDAGHFKEFHFLNIREATWST